MGEVKTALEKALEKVKEIKALTEEEKLEIRDKEKIKTTLASFFRGELTVEQMVERLKGAKRESIVEAQKNLAELIRLNISEEELNQKKDALISLETLKERKDVIAVEEALNVIRRIQREYNDLKDKAIQEVRVAIEQNPHLRVRPVRLPDGRVVQATLTVDEALQERLSEFIEEHDKRYERMFSRAVERLKSELR
ncbi:MAG: hypothetical protein ACK415_02260 [Thermodesulfovibrionales bacterium]